MGLIALAKAIDRAINGKPFGYPTKIDFRSRMMEANMILREQLDGVARRRLGRLASDMQAVAWQKPQSLQCRRYRDIEYAVRAAVQDKRGFQHLIGRGIDGNAAFASLAIEPANIAVRIVETHQAMNFVDDRECRIDRLFRRRARSRRRCGFRRKCQEAAVRGKCYRVCPYAAKILLTPSVTCMDDNVAPEMLRMSLPTLSGLALVLPTNCDSQLGLRTSPPYDSR